MHLERVLGQRQDLGRVERLHHVVEGPVLHRLDGGLRGAEGRHQHHQLLGIGRADVLEGLDPAHPAHPHIEENQVRRRALLDQRGALLAAGGLDHAVLPGRQHPRQGIADLGVVIDDQDGRQMVWIGHRMVISRARREPAKVAGEFANQRVLKWDA